MRTRLAEILEQDRFIGWLGWAVLTVVAVWLFFAGGTFWLYVAGLTVIYAISALGLDWIQGRAGQVSIGSAAFMAIGAFTGGVAYAKGVPSLLTLVIAGVAGGIVGLLVGLPALRLRGLYLALATLALQFIMSALGSAYESGSGQIAGVALGTTKVGPISLQAGQSFFVAVIILLVVCILALQRLYRRAPGRAWLAIKESEMSAGVIGIYPTRWKLSAFVASSALISISGGVLAFYTMRVQSETFSLDFAITFVAMVIVGGLGSIGGIISGAVLITVTPYLLSTWTASLPTNLGISQWLATNVYYINSGLYGILLLAFLLFQPRGIGGAADAVRRGLIRWLYGRDATSSRPRTDAAASIGPLMTSAPPSGPFPVFGNGERPSTGTADERLLDVQDLRVYRSGACAVDGVSLCVHPGEVVAIVGRNGAGKTSTLRAISGFFLAERSRVSGHVLFEGRDIKSLSPMATARLGLVLVPEREKIFPNLTVSEHFRIIGTDKSQLQDTYALFPQLEQRARSEAGLLSGGERQMLALAVAFCMRPKLLLVDELSLGLSPAAILRLTAALKDFQQRSGVALLLVEQNLPVAVDLADRLYVFEAGRVEREDVPSQLSEEVLTAAALGS